MADPKRPPRQRLSDKALLKEPTSGSLEQMLATIDSLPKDSSDFQRLRRLVFGKVITKQAKPELVAVFHEAVKRHGFDQVRLAFNQIKRENVSQQKKRKGKANESEASS